MGHSVISRTGEDGNFTVHQSFGENTGQPLGAHLMKAPIPESSLASPFTHSSNAALLEYNSILGNYSKEMDEVLTVDGDGQFSRPTYDGTARLSEIGEVPPKKAPVQKSISMVVAPLVKSDNSGKKTTNCFSGSSHPSEKDAPFSSLRAREGGGVGSLSVAGPAAVSLPAIKLPLVESDIVEALSPNSEEGEVVADDDGDWLTPSARNGAKRKDSRKKKPPTLRSQEENTGGLTAAFAVDESATTHDEDTFQFDEEIESEKPSKDHHPAASKRCPLSRHFTLLCLGSVVTVAVEVLQ